MLFRSPELTKFVIDSELYPGEVKRILTFKGGARRIPVNNLIFPDQDEHIYVLLDVRRHQSLEVRRQAIGFLCAVDPVILYSTDEYPEAIYPEPETLDERDWHQRAVLQRERTWGFVPQEMPANFCKESCVCPPHEISN